MMVNPVDDMTSILDRFEMARSRGVIILEDRASGCHCKAKVDLKNHKCRLIQVDGDNGITEIESEKCDWCVQDCDPHGRFLFVELKGSGEKAAVKAASQLLATIKWFQHHINDFKVNNHSYIVMADSCPSFRSCHQNIAPSFREKSGSNLVIWKQKDVIPLYR